ncbi:MAG: hypothetical protein EAZ43_04755 [Betaproteobacteria bacterium]|nr:MAG: hypothetical protein EAZ43_04755 [Betaproteobacteria bacterium]
MKSVFLLPPISRVAATRFGALVSTFALILLSGCGGDDSANNLPIAPLPVANRAQQDLQGVASFLERYHPMLADESLRAAFVSQRNAVIRGLDGKPDAAEWEVQRAMLQLIAPLNDFHVQVTGPVFQPSSGRSDYFPFAVRAIGGRLFTDGATAAVPHASEIATINGVTVSSILAALESTVSADSTASSVRRTIADAEFARRYHQNFGFASEYVIGFVSAIPTARVQGVAFANLPQERQTQPRWIRNLTPEARFPQAKTLANGVAYLSLPTFGIADRDAYFVALDAARASVKDPVNALIIDLRGNTGGFRDFAFPILNALTLAPYAQYRGSGVRERQIDSIYANNVKPLLANLPIDAALAGFPSTRSTGGLYWIDGDTLASQMKPSAPHFSGRIIVLADGLVASAATQMMAALVAVRPDTVIIGEETAGHCARHTGDVPMVYQSTNFAIALAISLARIDLASDSRRCSTTGGFKPDIAVTPTAEAVLANDDLVLKRALTVALAQN